MPLADFRATQDREALGQEFFDVYDDVIYKQTWFTDYLQGIAAAKLDYVGKFQTDTATVEELAADIRSILGLTRNLMRSASSADDLYSIVSERAESVGVLVFKNGVVGNNTRRALPVSQFRGFAIVDGYAPAVFVNGADAKAAWVFTLLHELAHIWLGESGVSDVAPKSNNRTEVLCNAAAAEILVPQADFMVEWNDREGVADLVRIDILRRHFKVSALVIARRALDRGFVSRAIYSAVYDAARKDGSASGGGNFYSTLGARNGKRFAGIVSDLARAGDLGLRHAGRLLNTTPSNVLNYGDRRNEVSD